LTRVTVNDLMQQRYTYVRTARVGRDFDPGFTPQLTPREMLALGVFGGKYMTDCQAEFPRSWFANAKLLFTDLGGSLGAVGTGVASGVDYCDFPVMGTAIGNRFAGIAFCVNGSCNNAQGELVLSGESINNGGIYTGYLDSPIVGGPAFRLCAGGCDDSFIYSPGGIPPTGSRSANQAPSHRSRAPRDRVLNWGHAVNVR
jgi:hypothetical protein